MERKWKMGIGAGLFLGACCVFAGYLLHTEETVFSPLREEVSGSAGEETVRLSAVSEENAPSYHIASSEKDICEIVYTRQDNELMGEFYRANLEFTLTDLSETITPEERVSVSSAPELNYMGGHVVIQYIGLDFYSELERKRYTLSSSGKPFYWDAEKSGAVEKLDSPILITIDIPEEFINTDPDIRRTYALISTRGAAYLPDLDREEGTLTVAVTSFGNYALLLKDMYENEITKEVHTEEDTGWVRNEDGRIYACTDSSDGEGKSYRYDEFGKRVFGWYPTYYDGSLVWMYYDPDTGYAVGPGWRQIEGEWYHFRGLMGDHFAVRDSEWLTDGGKIYYLGSDGAMLRSQWLTVDRKIGSMPAGTYYLTEDGSVLTDGWAESPNPGIYWYLRPGDGLFAEDDPACWSSGNPDA